MQKDFDAWNINKKDTHKNEKEKNFYEREVWWCIFGINIGTEIDGKHESFLRPAVIIRKFNKDMAIVVPTTTQDKDNKYYSIVSGLDNKKYNACLSQIRNMSSKRFFRKIGTIKETDYSRLLEKLSKMLKEGL